jgi:hypothetical protein
MLALAEVGEDSRFLALFQLHLSFVLSMLVHHLMPVHRTFVLARIMLAVGSLE